MTTPRTDFEKKKETPWYGHLQLKRLAASLFGTTPTPTPPEIYSTPISQALASACPSPFDMLPEEIIKKEIAHWLPDQPPAQDKGLLSNLFSNQEKLQSPISQLTRVSKHFHFLLQPDFIVNNFLHAVVNANQKKAEAILSDYPHLLSQLLQQQGQVTDYPGHTIYGSVLQIALGAEDVKYHDDEECMAEMLMRYIRTLPNGETIIEKQIAEQFPEGWEEKEKARAERDSAALNKVVTALENAAADDDCAAEISAFKQYLDDENKNSGVIKTGKHFNMQLLIDALNLYVQKFNQFGGSWDSPKNKLFWCKIIGKIERYVPACYAQALCQDVYDIVQNGKKLERRLTFRYDHDVTYYPLDSDPKFRLGENCGYWASADDAQVLTFGAGGGWWMRATSLQTMSDKKKQRREDYAAGAKHPVSELLCRKVAF